MPIFLPEPEAERPPGGWNRLSLNAHMGVGAECALRPRSYAALRESQDTRRARWGGFDWCVHDPRWEGKRPDCTECTVFKAMREPDEPVPFNAPRVLVRVERATVGELVATQTMRLWMTDRPDAADYRADGSEWTWERLARLSGWNLGRPHQDAIGEGFWMERTPAVPAWGVTIVTKTWASSTRHAIRVGGVRVALLHCVRECRHGAELLNALSHACAPHGDEARVPLHWTEVRKLGVGPTGGYRVVASVGSEIGLTLLPARALSPREEVAHVTLSGSGWTLERASAAAGCLVEHVG